MLSQRILVEFANSKEPSDQSRIVVNVIQRLIPREFYERDPETVARGLLGKRMIRKLGKKAFEGVIVETEAYFGPEDPASRAHHGRKEYNEAMWGEPGALFIYNVHKYWMLNVVAHRLGMVGAVLIRALEPTRGMEIMKANREAKDLTELTNGPGKLTEALRISKDLNSADVTLNTSQVAFADNEMSFEIESSHRIGVTEDLKKKLRFFIKGNDYVSR